MKFTKLKARKTYKMRPRRSFPFFGCLCGASLFFIVSGITLLCTWSYILDYITYSNSVLTPNSITSYVWKTNPMPLTIDFYFFNWTNPRDIHNNTIKPKFQQIGPYRFREEKEKVDVTWNNHNGTVSYKQRRRWFFDEENSKGSLYDSVTTLNPVALSASYTARNWSYFVKKGLSLTLKAMVPTVHITRSAGQLLFEGYDDPLMNVAVKMPFLAGVTLPPMDKFGWFYGRNGSADYEGIYNIDTGIKGQLGELYTWRHANKTGYYPDHCGKIEGSGGEFFPKGLDKDSIIRFFSSDLCRKVELEFEKVTEVNNIVGYKYSAQDRFLDNGTKVPENKCYCTGNCMPSGAVNVSACRYGSPGFISLPNFYNGDSYYVDSVEGVQPDKELHEFYMTFEPKTGIPLKAAARLQLNLLVQPDPTIALYADVPKVYFPMLWFEQVVTIPNNLAFFLKMLLNFKVICLSTGIISIFIGLLINFCFFYKLCKKNMCDKPKSKTILREQTPLKSCTSFR